MRQSKTKLRLFQLSMAALLFVIAVLPIQKTGLLSHLGQEDIYWERARYLLGQGGVSFYNGTSLCSLGYSILLLPICAVMKSPYAAYKTALILNGMFLTGSYVVSLLTVKKIFTEEEEGFLSFLCFAAAICPVFFVERMLTGPAMAVLFLSWCVFYLMADLWKNYSRGKLVLLTAILIVIGFLQISMLGMILGVVCILAFFVKRDRMTSTAFLTMLLVLMIGIMAGNIAERAVLYRFASDKDLTVVSSMEVLLDKMMAGWDKGKLTGVFQIALGKLLSLMIGTFFLICPGLWELVKRGWKAVRGKKCEEKDVVYYGIFLAFLLQLLTMALYGNSGDLNRTLTSLDGLLAVTAPILVVSGIRIRRNCDWTKSVMGYVLFACVCIFVTANICQIKGIDRIADINSGIFYPFTYRGMSAVSTIYMSGCLAILLFIILFGCWKIRSRYPRMNQAIRSMGTALLVLSCMASGAAAGKTAVIHSVEKGMGQEAVIASLMNAVETPFESYTLYNHNRISILQSLVPEQKITVIEGNAKAQSEFFDSLKKLPENVMVITGTDEHLLYRMKIRKLTDFRLIYIAGDYALWARENSEAAGQLEQAVEARRIEWDVQKETSGAETVGAEAEEENSMLTDTYRGNLTLAPGTYRLEVQLGKTEAAGSCNGKINILDEEGPITGKYYDEQNFSEDGNAVVSIEFTGREVMRNISLEVVGEKKSGVTVKKLYYYKYSDAYMIGCEAQTSVIGVSDFIKELDQETGVQGRIAYVDGLAEYPGDISLERYAGQLTGYEIDAVTVKELPEIQSEYLIADTASHDYFGAMDGYSIIWRDKDFTVLVRNDSQQFKRYVEKKGEPLSENELIKIQAYTGSKAKAERPIALAAGTYFYHVRLNGNLKEIPNEAEPVGTLYIKNGGSVAAQQTVYGSDVWNTADLRVPFSLNEGTKKLKCEFVPEQDAEVTAVPTGIELETEHYQFGRETPELLKWYQLFEKTSEDKDIAVVTLEKNVLAGGVDYTYLKKHASGKNVKVIAYEEAVDAKEDMYLITYGFAARGFNLLKYYTIVDQIGQYTLWVRSDGELLKICGKEGYSVKSSGIKFSPEVAAVASGKDYEEDKVAYLPNGRYRFTIELTAETLEADDTVEIFLVRNKSKTELAEEKAELIASGYTEAEAEKLTEVQKVCGTHTCEAYQFDDSNRIVVSVTMNEKVSVNNLTAEAYSWQGRKVEAKIIWAEIL